MESKHLLRATYPEEVGVSSKVVHDFIRYCEGEQIYLHSFMIVRHGKVAVEVWRKPFNAETPHTMYSFSKSIVATAIGIAIGEGLLSLDTNVYDLFPDKAPKRRGSRAKALNVSHLLSMTSGKLMNPLADLSYVDWEKNFLYAPFSHDPGEKFFYTNENSFMLAAIIRRVSGEKVVDYLMPRLFEPLGIKRPFWEADQFGTEAGGWGLQLRTEDQAKIMQCYLQKGKWKNAQLIPQEWIADATRFQVDNSPGTPDNRVGYGYHFWINRLPNSYRADGLFSQFGLVLSDYDACIAINAGAPDEQKTLDAVWRFFPKAFIDDVKEDKESLDELNKRIDSLKIEGIPVHERNEALEKLLNDRTISTQHTTTFHSVLPLAAAFMLSKKPGKISDIHLAFDDEGLRFSFNEKNSPRNTIVAGMDGEYRKSRIQIGKLELDVMAKATWHVSGTLELYYIPLQLTQARRFFLDIAGDGKVKIRVRSERGMNELATFYIGFMGMPKAKKFISLVNTVVKKAEPVTDPTIYGHIAPKKRDNLAE